MEHGFPSHRQPSAARIERTPEEEKEYFEQQEERLQLALQNRLAHKRSIFTPGSRIRMNIIPLFLNVLIPWAVFIFCCGLTSFSVMYTARSVVYALIALLVLLWLLLVSFVVVPQRKNNPDPTWWSYAALAIGIAAVSGIICGLHNFTTKSRPYYEIEDLKVIHQLNVRSEQGQNFMDAGVVYFAKGNELDRGRSWHFRHHKLYCVAPVVDSSQQSAAGEASTAIPSIDFWAVGTDCCSPSSSDFRCGSWDSSKARSAIRVLDDSAIPYYRLAVQQAETLYGLVAAHPIFFEWAEDPLAKVNGWSSTVFRDYLFMVATALVVSLFAVSLTTCRFSMIARKGSRLERDYYYDQGWGDFYNDDTWQKGLSDYNAKYNTM